MSQSGTWTVQPGNTAVYDPPSGQYVYDLDTTGLAPGEWTVRLRLDDGTNRFTSFVVQ